MSKPVVSKDLQAANAKPLAGKVALVTGGSRGIGAAIAKELADQGADVAISYAASADKAEAVARELKSKGVRAAAFKADQADAHAGRGLGQGGRQGVRAPRYSRQQCRRVRRRRPSMIRPPTAPRSSVNSR